MSDSLNTTLSVSGTEDVKAKLADVADTTRAKLESLGGSADLVSTKLNAALGKSWLGGAVVPDLDKIKTYYGSVGDAAAKSGTAAQGAATAVQAGAGVYAGATVAVAAHGGAVTNLGATYSQLSTETLRFFSDFAEGRRVFAFTEMKDMVVTLGQSGDAFGVLGGIAQKSLGALLSPIGLVVTGITAAAGAVAYLGYAAESQDRALNTLGTQLSATRADYSAMAAEATAAAKAVAATTGISGADARTAAQTIVAAPDFSGDQAHLQALIVEAGNVAKIMGTDVPKAAEVLAEALKDPEVEAQKLATSGLPTMGRALVDQIKLLQEGGDKAQATALVLKALNDASSHVDTDGLTDMQKALHALGAEFAGTGASGETFAHAVGSAIDAMTTQGIRNITAILSTLDKAYNYVKGIASIPAPAAQPQQSGNVTLGPVQADGQRAVGLFQVNPRTADTLNRQLATGYDAESGSAPSYDLNTLDGNIQAGLTTLKQYVAQGGTQNAGLARYGGYGSNVSAASGYIGKIAAADVTTLPTDIAGRIAYWGQALGMPQDMIVLGQKLALVESSGKQFTGATSTTASPYAGQTRDPHAGSFGIVAPGYSDAVTASNRATLNDGLKLADSLDPAIAKTDDLNAKIQLLQRDLAIPGQTTDTYTKLSQALAILQGRSADNLTTQQAATRALQEQANTAQSTAGYERTLAQVQQEFADKARSAGTTDQASLNSALAAKIKLLASAYQDGTDALQKQLDLQGASIQVYGQGAAAVQHATDYATAYKAALANFAKDSPEFNAAVASRTAVLDQLAQVQARGQDLAATHTNDNQLQYIQAETSSLGMNEDARTKLLAVMKAEQAEHDKFGATLPAESQAYLASVGAIQDATIAYQHQQSSMAELSTFATTAFGNISTAITQAFATGSIKAISFGAIAKSVFSEIVSEVLKLGVLNPILNTLFDGKNVTLDGVGGVLGSLLGNGLSPTSTALNALGTIGGKAVDGPATPAAVAAAGGTSGGGLTTDLGILGIGAKAVNYVFPNLIGSAANAIFGTTAATNAALGTLGAAGGLLGPATPTAVAAAGGTLGVLGSDVGLGGASSATGGIGTALGGISGYLPFIGGAIGTLTNVLQGNYIGASLVAAGTAIGATIGSVVPGIGTAIGAGVGALVGEVGALFTGPKKLNSFESTSVGDTEGFLSLNNSKQQANKDTSNFNNLVSAVASLNTLLASSGTRLAGSNTANMFDVGYGVKGDANFYDNLGAAFPKLRFGAAANDSADYKAAINANVADTSFSGQDTLKAAIDAADALAAHLESLGVTVSSVNKGLAGFTVGSVGGYANSNLNTALNSDLSGKSFGSTAELDTEVGKVQQFVLTTLPGLVSATGTSLSQYQQQQQALDTTYDDAKKTAASYGLSVTDLANTQIMLEKKLAQTAIDALAANEQTYQQRTQAATGDALGAQFSQLDASNASQKAALTALFTNYYGTASLTSQYYLNQLNELEAAQGAERVQIVQQYTDQINAASRSIDVTVASSKSAGLRAQATVQGLPSYSPLNEQADLQDFNNSAYDQVQALGKSLVSTYGASVTSTAGYASDIATLENSLAEQRLAIQKKYSDQALAAQTTASSTATAAAAAAAQAQQTAAGSAASAIASLTQYAQTLQTGATSPLSARDQYALAKSQFAADATSAAAGNPTALSGLSAASTTLLAASRTVNDTGSAYVADFNEVLQAIQGVAALPSSAVTTTFLTQNTQTQTQTLTDALAALKSEVVALRVQVAQQGNRPMGLAA